jgi:hypothetical protein
MLEVSMLDVVYIVIFLVLLAATIGFVAACGRLMPTDTRSKP